MAFQRLGNGLNWKNLSSILKIMYLHTCGNGYFTKWVEVKPLKTTTQVEIIDFIKEHIIHRFGIPQTITLNHGTSFNGNLMDEFTKEYEISIINSTHYYAQANGQAKATNKAIKFIMQKTISEIQ